MRFHLFLLFFFSHHSFIFFTNAYSTNNTNYYHKDNSSINIDLYQCGTNATIVSSTTNNTDTIYKNLIDSCNISCCSSNTSNETISSKICQVTVQSSTGICLGRLCYSGECDKFTSLANATHDNKVQNKTTIINQIRSSFSSIPWSSLVNSTQTKWNSWIDKTGLTLHDILLVILLILNISLTFMTLIVVIKSIRHANLIADEKSYRYTLL